MDERNKELLQQIAIDVAVIKSEIQDIRELKSDVKVLQEEVTELKTQMRLVRWVSSSSIVAFLGYIIVKLAKILI